MAPLCSHLTAGASPICPTRPLTCSTRSTSAPPMVLATARFCSSSALSPITTPPDWSRDGQFILYEHESPETQSDLWALPLTGSRQPNRDRENPVRRDGWAVLAGRTVDRVHVERGRTLPDLCSTLPRPGTEPARCRPSLVAMPRWRRDGAELFYVARRLPVDRPAGDTARHGTGVRGPAKALHVPPRMEWHVRAGP